MTLNVQTFNRQKLQSAVFSFILAEDYNFEQVTIPAASQANSSALFDIGTVLGQIANALTATSAVKASGANTGGGSLTVDGTTPVLPGAKPGVYTVRETVAAAVIGTHSGLFEVRDPDGKVLGEVEVGQTFADQIKFSIAYATADFVVGDGFDVTVGAGSGKYVQLNPAAADGSQNVAGVVARAVTVDGSVDTPAAVAVRGPVNLKSSGLVWPSGITDNQKAAAIVQLAKLGLIVRNV
jgi:hypothetical protein